MKTFYLKALSEIFRWYDRVPGGTRTNPEKLSMHLSNVIWMILIYILEDANAGTSPDVQSHIGRNNTCRSVWGLLAENAWMLLLQSSLLSMDFSAPAIAEVTPYTSMASLFKTIGVKVRSSLLPGLLLINIPISLVILKITSILGTSRFGRNDTRSSMWRIFEEYISRCYC
jgi:hypothetical protein